MKVIFTALAVSLMMIATGCRGLSCTDPTPITSVTSANIGECNSCVGGGSGGMAPVVNGSFFLSDGMAGTASDYAMESSGCNDGPCNTLYGSSRVLDGVGRGSRRVSGGLRAGMGRRNMGCAGGGMCNGRCGGRGACGGRVAQALWNSPAANHFKAKTAQTCANGTCGLPPGPQSGSVHYPYYTVRGPRDFLMANPPSIGP